MSNKTTPTARTCNTLPTEEKKQPTDSSEQEQLCSFCRGGKVGKVDELLFVTPCCKKPFHYRCRTETKTPCAHRDYFQVFVRCIQHMECSPSCTSHEDSKTLTLNVWRTDTLEDLFNYIAEEASVPSDCIARLIRPVNEERQPGGKAERLMPRDDQFCRNYLASDEVLLLQLSGACPICLFVEPSTRSN